MKVKSFVVGTINGLQGSFKTLDELVAAELKGARIHDVKDTPLSADVLSGTDPKGVDHIVRVVIYS